METIAMAPQYQKSTNRRVAISAVEKTYGAQYFVPMRLTKPASTEKTRKPSPKTHKKQKQNSEKQIESQFTHTQNMQGYPHFFQHSRRKEVLPLLHMLYKIETLRTGMSYIPYNCGEKKYKN